MKSLRDCETYCQLVLESVTATEPPENAQEGARWFVPSGATGAFSGHGGKLAMLEGGSFDFVDFPDHTLAFIRDEQRFVAFVGNRWVWALP